jgi:hypothetical protein
VKPGSSLKYDNLTGYRIEFPYSQKCFSGVALSRDAIARERGGSTSNKDAYIFNMGGSTGYQAVEILNNCRFSGYKGTDTFLKGRLAD